MTIKYSVSKGSLFKMLLLFACFSNVLTSNAQIVGGEENPEEEKKDEKKAPKEKMERDSLSGITYYATGLFTHGFRSFEDNTPFDSYADWYDQTPGSSGGFSIGMFMPLNDWLSLDLGFTYFGQKEQYNYAQPNSDSTYFFSNTYMYIGVPVRLRYTYGEKFQFFAFAGLTPLNLLNIRFNEKYTTQDGSTVEPETAVDKDKLAIFNVQATAGLGVSYNFEWVGFTLYPEFRQNLFQTYDQSRPIEHKMYSLGVHAGMTLRF